jgi:hypothetical protein
MARRRNWFGLWILLLILGTVFGLEDVFDPSPRTSSYRATLLPDEDDFYKPPPGFEKTPVGSILRHRPVPNPITLNNVDPIKVRSAWQLLYRTQNSVEEPTATVVTVIVPYRAKPDHLFSYAYFSVCWTGTRHSLRFTDCLKGCCFQRVHIYLPSFNRHIR